MDKRPKTKQPAKKPALQWLIKALPWILIVCGIVGILASLMITQEKFDLAANPHYQPACDLNPIVSCGSVMQSPQANAFGFTNPYIGLIGFPIVLTIGVAMLAGAKFKRWFWVGLQIGLSLGLVFAYWLLYESVYSINALCPYCLSVDVVLTIAVWYTTLYNFRQGHLKVRASCQKAVDFASRHHLDIIVLWFLIVIAIILKHFWYYYGQHI
ncbi:MAG: vitamin K epoxide reductase family protein [Candidatus Saccharimonadales bacterium]